MSDGLEGQMNAKPTPTTDLLVVASWCGIAFGLLEALVATGLREFGLDRYGSAEIWWIGPTFGFAVSACLVLGLNAVARLGAPRVDPSIVLGLLSAVFAAALLIRLTPLLGVHRAAVLILAIGFGAVVRRWMRPRLALAVALARRSIVALLAVVVLTVGVDSLGGALRERRALEALGVVAPTDPNVLLIVVDTLRADHVSSYGYHRPTTPNLDRLAAVGVLFENAIANSSWTLPSHASLFTGELPSDHGADWELPLGSASLTLAEVLAARGYVTGGFSANTEYVTAAWGLDRGFSRFESHGSSLAEDLTQTTLGRSLALTILPRLGYFDIVGRKRAHTVSEEFVTWLDRRKAGRPFFAFLNYFDAHDPYVPPTGHTLRFSPSAHRGDSVNYQFQGDGFRRKPVLSMEDIQSAIDGYDECIAYVDSEIGKLVETLGQRGILDDTLIVVTSDHGEAFGNHDLFGHGNSLYMETLKVPLVLVWPHRIPAGRRVREIAGLNQVPATVLDLIADDPDGFPGRSLTDSWRTRSHQEPVFASLSPGRFLGSVRGYPAATGPISSLVTDRWHWLLSDDGQTQLFDWRHDTSESENLAGSGQGRARPLRTISRTASRT